MDKTGHTARQIENYIEDKRADLGSNLQELERKVRSATDWQQYFQRNPLTMLGIAFGSGVFLSVLAGRRSRRHIASHSRGESSDHNAYHPSASSGAKDKTLEAWDTIKDAVVGVAAMHFKKYAEKILPGFEAQYDKAAARTDRVTST